jgi:hypothetical protein
MYKGEIQTTRRGLVGEDTYSLSRDKSEHRKKAKKNKKNSLSGECRQKDMLRQRRKASGRKLTAYKAQRE